MTYDGGEWSFPVSVKSDSPYSDNNVAVHYYDSDGTELESAPVNAGKYFIRAYLEETEEGYCYIPVWLLANIDAQLQVPDQLILLDARNGRFVEIK